MLGNLRSLGALLLLFLLVSSCFAALFFFVARFAGEMGIARPGWFFTVSTLTEIGVRFGGGRMLDRLPKARVMAVALVFLALMFLLLAYFVKEFWSFTILGLFFGLGWGVILPLLSAFLFDLSLPKMRSFNTNLGFTAFQAGFLLGPALAGLLTGWGSHSFLYLACALSCLSGLLLAAPYLRVRA
jgi:MFS family permease